jgi:phospholipid/cholesterol/gamma-HCH transport system substrate-binding protein
VPSRKEIQWSQLRVGALVLAAMAVLIVLIFLMSRSTGGLFARKLALRCYFENASGLKDGAPVTLEGVTIGNVIHVRVVPSRNPTPVEVTMQVGHEYLRDLHTDSTASIAQAGVLGDSFLDISSAHATGPAPGNDAELKVSGSPSIQDVVRNSNDSIVQVQTVMRKIDTLLDTLNSRRGTLGELINDPQLGHKITQIATDLQTITAAISTGKGSLGKLAKDPAFAQKLDDTVTRLDSILTSVDEGKGSLGQLVQNRSLYDHADQTLDETQQLVKSIREDPKKYLVIRMKIF